MVIGPQSPHHKIVIITTARCFAEGDKRHSYGWCWLVLAPILRDVSILVPVLTPADRLLTAAQITAPMPWVDVDNLLFLPLFIPQYYNTHFYAIFAKNVN